MSRWRARCRSRSGPSRKGVVAVRRALGAASLPRSVPSRSRPAPQGCPARCAPRSAMARTRRPAWCDASLACFGRSAPQRCGAPQQRVPGNRSASGQPGGRRWSADAVGLPARLWSPEVRLGPLARRCPPVRRWVRAGGPSPRAQPPSTVPTASRGLPSPAHRTSDGPAAGYACTSRTVPREGPRAQPPSASAAGRHDGTTVVMLQDGKPRRATGLGLPATADHRNALLVRSKALKSHRPRWHRGTQPGNDKRATARGDAGTAVRVEKALEGVASAGKPRQHACTACKARKPDEPQDRQWDATSPRVSGGGSRRGGEKPRGRNMQDGGIVLPKAASPRQLGPVAGSGHRSAMSMEGRSLENPEGGAR
jgi:hypothetical protein